MDYLYGVKTLVLSNQTGDWCRLPYPNHPKGCPNYGRKDNCPPKAPLLIDYFDIYKGLYIVHSEFDLYAHAALMKKKHPDWTDRQCRCVLYWQGKSRKQLKERTQAAMAHLGTDTVSTCPEAMGVNVFVTARLSGLVLDKTRNLNICRHVNMLGWRK